MADDATEAPSEPGHTAYFCEYERRGASGPGQIVLALQGGGALGAFQAGVYEALHERGLEPDWVIGTSIGAINAALIVGNPPDRRLAALREFWRRIECKQPWHDWAPWPQLAQSLSFLKTLQAGLPGFFEPNPTVLFGPQFRMDPEQAAYYSTRPLEGSLADLVDIELINRAKPRLTVGAAHVTTSEMRYFDTRSDELSLKHVLASGALPPAFPAVRIGGELYWDGGILSNSPTEVVFADYPRRDSLMFSVHLWNPEGPEPQTLWEVAHRQKDIQYSSRVSAQIVRQQEAHRLRHIIAEMMEHMPDAARRSNAVRELAAYGCLTQMHVVRLLTPRLAHEDQTKDVDFTPEGIQSRWQAGYASAKEAIAAAPWRREVDRREGVILHEPGPEGWGPPATE